MSEINVDFLLKDELTYELSCRSVGIPENETVWGVQKTTFLLYILEVFPLMMS